MRTSVVLFLTQSRKGEKDPGREGAQLPALVQRPVGWELGRPGARGGLGERFLQTCLLFADYLGYPSFD